VHILVVDDERNIRNNPTMVIEAEGGCSFLVSAQGAVPIEAVSIGTGV
jgi:hypothetical protein